MPPIHEPLPPVGLAGGDPAARVNVRVSDSPVAASGGPAGEPRAGANPRIIATAIDLVVWVGLWILLGMFLPNSLAWLVSGAYVVLRDSLPFLDGQSIGKKVMKLRAVTLEGAPLTGNWAASAIRNAALIVPLFPIVELIVLLTREDGRDHGSRLGDEWAKTKVLLVTPEDTGDGDGEETAA
jgi:uncharacterized RDD family membrane protein YckC